MLSSAWSAAKARRSTTAVRGSQGGLDADENLQLLCSPCNRTKGGRRTMTELRQLLQQRSR